MTFHVFVELCLKVANLQLLSEFDYGTNWLNPFYTDHRLSEIRSAINNSIMLQLHPGPMELLVHKIILFLMNPHRRGLNTT